MIINDAAKIKINPTDFIAGANDAFSEYDEILYEDGNIEYLPENESQIGIYFDSYGCTNFSANNALETDGDCRIAKNIYSQETIDWLKDPVVDGVHYPSYIKNGKLNFSDRDLTVMSGTDPEWGNWIGDVADTARNQGLIPEAMAPWDFRNPDHKVNNKENYYNYKRTPEAQKVADEFKRRFEVRYRFVNLSGFKDESKKRVIQIISCGNRAKRNGKYYCVNTPTGHAMMLARKSDNSIFDHYEPYLINLESDKDFYATGLSFSLVEKNMNIDKPNLKDNTLVQLVSGIGGFGLYLDGHILVDDTAKILASFLVRTNGNTFSMVKPLTQEQWDLFPKKNLKGEVIN